MNIGWKQLFCLICFFRIRWKKVQRTAFIGNLLYDYKCLYCHFWKNLTDPKLLNNSVIFNGHPSIKLVYSKYIQRTWWPEPEPDYMYQKCLCEYNVFCPCTVRVQMRNAGLILCDMIWEQAAASRPHLIIPYYSSALHWACSWVGHESSH